MRYGNRPWISGRPPGWASLREAFRRLTNVIPCAYARRRFACTGLRIANNVLILVVFVNRRIANNVLILLVFVNRRVSNNVLKLLIFVGRVRRSRHPAKRRTYSQNQVLPTIKAPAGAFYYIRAYPCLFFSSNLGDTRPYSVQPIKVTIAPYSIASSPEE